MVRYDPAVIQSFADSLYNKARQVIVTWTLLGVLLGGALAGFGTSSLLGSASDTAGMPILFGTLFGAFLVGALGYKIGVERAFHLKLKAQLALCQLMTEANTRQAGGAGRQPAPPDRARAA